MITILARQLTPEEITVQILYNNNVNAPTKNKIHSGMVNFTVNFC